MVDCDTILPLVALALPSPASINYVILPSARRTNKHTSQQVTVYCNRCDMVRAIQQFIWSIFILDTLRGGEWLRWCGVQLRVRDFTQPQGGWTSLTVRGAGTGSVLRQLSPCQSRSTICSPPHRRKSRSVPSLVFPLRHKAVWPLTTSYFVIYKY